VNGCVRDSRELAGIEVGVLALAPNPLRSNKMRTGRRDVPLHFGGVVWTPDHYVYADEDGVVVVARERLHDAP
jgi:regulator of ribonuclease activity A